ncbi:MAG TPA: hypothetical protein VN285_07440 [Candidatus Deferrimicrobium sp.]|nr:hypothetical protein [Candidatus Deferrimicrobium sp.]
MTELRRNFLAASGSAILLSLAHVFHDLWFLSLFALVPFLWRLYQVNLRGAITLGLMLATFYVCATSMSDLILAPQTLLLKLVTFNGVIIAFALAVNRGRRIFGFDPVFVALLWFPLEYLLIEYAGLEPFFVISKSGFSLGIGFCTLFGLLLGSLVIVLGNALLLLILRYAGRWLLSRDAYLTGDNDNTYDLLDKVTLKRQWYCFPDVRAPPLHACNQVK